VLKKVLEKNQSYVPLFLFAPPIHKSPVVLRTFSHLESHFPSSTGQQQVNLQQTRKQFTGDSRLLLTPLKRKPWTKAAHLKI
jgi:hypothetical protein